MPKYVNVTGVGKVAFPDGISDDQIKSALDKEYGKPQAAPFRGALSSVEQAAGTIPKAAATLIESQTPAIDRNKIPIWKGEEFGTREPMTADGRPGSYQTPTIPPAYSLRPRIPSEVLKAVPENPLFKIGQTAQESVPMTTLQEKSNWTKVGEMAGSGAEMALGPLAIPAYAAQPLGEVTDEFESIKRENPHMDVNEAADQAFSRSIEKGVLTAGTFYAIPKVLRGPLEKYLVNKLGTTGFKNWVAGRAAAVTEGAALGGAQAAGQQALEGKAPDINTAKSAAGFAMMNALLPWRRAQKGGPNAQAVRSDKGQVRPTGGKPQGVQNQGGKNIQQPPPGQPQPVGTQPEAKVSLRAKNYDVQFDDEAGRWVVLDPANNVVKDFTTQGAAVAHANELHDKDEAAKAAAPKKEEPSKQEPQLSAEDQAHIDAERGTVDVPVEIVKTGTTEADEPFAKDLQRLGGISTVDRKTGKIVINPTEFHDWLQGIPVEQRPQAVRSLLSEERIHLATTDADADAYFKSLSGIERAIGKRRYSGSWSGSNMPDMTDTLWGHEALRTRMQQLARMTPREIAEASGRERWTLQSITALESVVRNIREKMGTKASKEALSILDRIGANLKAGKVVAAGAAPGAINKEQASKNEQELRDEAKSLRERGNEQDAAELEGMADWLKQRTSEEAFPMARRKQLDDSLTKPGDIGRQIDSEIDSINSLEDKYSGEYVGRVNNLLNYLDGVKKKTNKVLSVLESGEQSQLLNDHQKSKLEFVRTKWIPYLREVQGRLVRGLSEAYEAGASSPMARKKVPKEQMGLDDILGKARFEQMRMASTDPKIMKDARRQMFKDAMDALAPREPMAMQSSNRPNPAAEKVADEVGGLKYIGNWQVKDKGYWMFNITQPGRETTMVVPEGVSREALQKKRDDKIAEYDAAEKSPMARPKKRRESVFQESMGFILPSVNTAIEAVKEGPQMPPASAKEAGARPALSPDEWMKKQADLSVKGIEEGKTSGGSVNLPKFKDFSEAMKLKFGGETQPGQLKEMWQNAVDKLLNDATDQELRGLIQAGFGRESRLARFANAALSFESSEGKLKQAGIFPGMELPKEKKFREKAPQPKLVDDKGKPVRPPRDLGEEAAVRQESKEQRTAPRRRKSIIAALFKKMVLPAYREDALPLDRKEVGPSEIRNGGGKLISAYQSFDATGQEDPELPKMLVDESRRSGEDSVTTTKRLTVIMNKKTGRVSMVSTYAHPTKGTMLVDPEHPQGHHAQLEDMQRRYRVLYSVLLDQPVKGFKRNFDSVADYNTKFGDEARENYTRETSYDPNAVSIPEFMSEVEGSEGVEGEGGDLMGPGKRAAMAVTGVGEGAVEKSSFTPITGAEKDAIIDHMNAELGGDPQSIDDTRAIIDDLAVREGKQSPAVLSGLQKLAQLIQRENPGMPTEDLVNLMAKRLYEDKNLEATIAATEKAAASKAGPATRPEVPEAASQTSRELSMLNRRPPTDVRPENVPIGTEQPTFLHNPPVPVATVTPRDPEYLSPEDAQYVNELALQNHPGYVPTDPEGQSPVKPHEEPKLLKERSPMARSKPMEELDKKRRQINANWLRRATNKVIKMTADGVDNDAVLEGERARRSLRLLNPDEMIRSAPIALLSTGKIGENPKTGKKFFFYDPKMIDSKITQARIGSSKAEAILNDPKADRTMKKYAAKWKEAADRLHLIAQYVKDHWTDKDMRDMAAGVRRELYDQLLREHAAGVSTTDFGETYFPTRYEGEMFNLDTITFGEDRIIGNRFTARKKFRDHYEAVMNGPFVPKSYDSADIIGHRVRQGMKSVARSTWHEALKDMKDSASGRPVAMAPVPAHPRNLVDIDTGDKVFHHDSWEAPSPEYELVYPTPSSQPVAVLKPYADLVNTLMEKSAFQGKPLGEAALYFTSMLKHGVVLVGDTFHPARLIQYATAMRGGVPAWRNGFAALMYRPEDLDAAVKAGEVHPESANWAKEKVSVKKGGAHTLMTKQEILGDMVSKGLNATRIGDALYKDAVQKIPIIGEALYHGYKGYGIGGYNRLLFDKFIPGLISDGAVRSFMRLHEANPDVPYEKLMRDVITDMNTFYGNMGRQGVFSSATFRDFAQVFMLAPMWQEGLIGKEVRMMGRLTGISNLTGRRGLPQFGALGSAMLRGLAGYFVLTQVINLITRGQTTFQNKEKGHMLDAWIPTGKESGVWLSPLAVFAEKTHDLIRLAETKPKVWDAIMQMGENTLGPVGKFESVLRTSRKPTGEYLTTTSGLLEAAVGQLAPVPISAGKPLAWAAYAAGMGPKPEPGTTARQMMASFGGIKTQAGQDVNTQVEASARKFAQDNMLKADSQVIIPTDEPSYAKMRHAFKIGDDRSTKQLFDALMAKKKPWESRGDRAQQILADMQHWARRPMTGSYKGDMLWKHSMTDDERKLYGEALTERMELLYGWEKWYLQERSGPH